MMQVVVLVQVAVLQVQVSEGALHLVDVVAEHVVVGQVGGFAVRVSGQASAVLADVVDGGISADEVHRAVRGAVDPREGRHVLGGAQEAQDIRVRVVHGSRGRIEP